MRRLKGFREDTLNGLRNPYDTVAYPSRAYAHTHPDRMAAMAILHGLAPAPVEHCRVLEVACGDGANLIPMAYAIPAGEFVGFDLAQLPIERGQERLRELGLRNIRLFQADLLEVGAELGRFDYIIAHGIYAWVPQPVRDRLLALASELLAADGIAFVSYNALPGSYLRIMLRDMMLYSTQDVDDAKERAAQGVQFLSYLRDVRQEDDVYRKLLETQLAKIEKRDLAVTCHDELSDVYHPVYFSDFVAHARSHGLQYLSDAVLPPPPDPSYNSEIQSALESAACGDDVRKEQLLDFARMRLYRETLLCRADRVVKRGFAAEYFRRLFFASHATAARGETPGSRVFALPGGMRMESNHPSVTALLTTLGSVWPCALGFDELEALIAESGFVLEAGGAAFLIRLAIAKMIELHAWKAPVAQILTERPKASAICRQEARAQQFATSLQHEAVNLEDPKVRALLRLLDGTRDRNALLAAMKAEFPGESGEELEVGLDRSLKLFHATGVLEA